MSKSVVTLDLLLHQQRPIQSLGLALLVSAWGKPKKKNQTVGSRRVFLAGQDEKAQLASIVVVFIGISRHVKGIVGVRRKLRRESMQT